MEHVSKWNPSKVSPSDFQTHQSSVSRSLVIVLKLNDGWLQHSDDNMRQFPITWWIKAVILTRIRFLHLLDYTRHSHILLVLIVADLFLHRFRQFFFSRESERPLWGPHSLRLINDCLLWVTARVSLELCDTWMSEMASNIERCWTCKTSMAYSSRESKGGEYCL